MNAITIPNRLSRLRAMYEQCGGAELAGRIAYLEGADFYDANPCWESGLPLAEQSFAAIEWVDGYQQEQRDAERQQRAERVGPLLAQTIETLRRVVTGLDEIGAEPVDQLIANLDRIAVEASRARNLAWRAQDALDNKPAVDFWQPAKKVEAA